MKVGIIGSGAMGSGIAQVAASAGASVKMYDKAKAALEESQENLQSIMQKLVDKGKYSVEQTIIIKDSIEYVHSLEDLHDSDLIIEAIIEDLEIKQRVFENVESLVSEACIIATNTSSLSITVLAAVFKQPERFLGMHFFNPAPVMELVEIIPALQTDSTLPQKIKEILLDWKKAPVIAKDTPGFIVNKVARPFYGEALKIKEERLADEATIDWAMTEIADFRMGPFALMDYIGHDVNYKVTNTVFESFYFDGRYRPSLLQKQLVDAGYLGKKSGRGFYDYNSETQPDPNTDLELGNVIVEQIVGMLINEAADTLHRGIASKEDIDLAMTKGVNYPLGLFAWADKWGIQKCISIMDRLYDKYREERYRCSPILRKMNDKNLSFYGET